MPTRAARPCSHPRCPNLVSDGSRCPKHQRQEYARQDARRGTSAQRGYDARWRKIRAQVLREELPCRMCLDVGRTTAATEVDHIDGNPWNRARENLRPLCKSCHSSRTARDQGFGRKGRQCG